MVYLASMSKNSRFVGLVVALLGFTVALSGCNDYSSPQGVIGAAVSSLKKEKVKAFKRTLRGEALKQYGNLIGMAELLKILQEHEFSIGKVTLLEERLNRIEDPVFRLFSVELISQAKQGVGQQVRAPFSVATVECDVNVTYTGFESGIHQNCYMTPSGTVCVPGPGYSGAIQRREMQRCYITELR